MFGHDKTLEKPLYKQKTTIELKICEVSQPGQNRFYVLTRPGWNSFSEVYEFEFEFICTIWENTFFEEKKEDEYQAQIYTFFLFHYLQNGPKNAIKKFFRSGRDTT